MSIPINIKATYNLNLDQSYFLFITLANDDLNNFGFNDEHTVTIGSLDIPNDIWPTIQAAIAYYAPIMSANAVSAYNAVFGAGTYTTGSIFDLGSFTLDALAAKQDALPTGGNSGQYVGGDFLLHTLPSAPTASFATPTFSSITTATMLSSSQKAFVSYDIDAAINISLLAGQSVTATLTYADNSAMTTNPVVVSSQTASNSGVLGLTQGNTLKPSGFIPPNKYRKVSFAVTGSATTPSSLKAGQEVLM